jgi:hypothetical protein
MSKETGTCSTCHWWSEAFMPEKEHRTCVWHSGMKGEKKARIEFGGNKPLRTSADFGCLDWTEDTRVK